MRVAILGGSFYPIHLGHIAIAENALQQLEVDEIWFLPSHKTPLKSRDLTSDEDRLNMLYLATEDNPKFKVCTIEMERQGISYTVDTLRALKEIYPAYTFYWMIGNDQLEQFSAWKEPDEICKLAHVVAYNRDGKICKTSYPIQSMYMKDVPVSSSDIRVGNKLNYLNPKVLDYIYDHRLYVKNFVKTRVKEKRYLHTLSVAKLCEEIAKANGLDVQKAYYVGLFHDIAKSMPVDEMAKWMEIICPENMHYAYGVWHGFVGSEIVDRIFGINDFQIKNAIYHHVLGTSDDPYAMVVFCADKLDPLRGYEVQPMIDICKRNIYEGFYLEKEENAKYVKEHY